MSVHRRCRATAQSAIEHATPCALSLPMTSASPIPYVGTAVAHCAAVHEARQVQCALPPTSTSPRPSLAATRNELTCSKDHSTVASRTRAATSHGTRRAGWGSRTHSHRWQNELPPDRNTAALPQQTTKDKHTSRHDVDSCRCAGNGAGKTKKGAHKHSSVCDERYIPGEYTARDHTSTSQHDFDACTTTSTSHSVAEETGQCGCRAHSHSSKLGDKKVVEAYAECFLLDHEGDDSRSGGQARGGCSALCQTTERGASRSLFTAHPANTSADSHSGGTAAHAMEAAAEDKTSTLTLSQATVLMTPRSPTDYSALPYDTRDKDIPIAVCREGTDDRASCFVQGQAGHAASRHQLPQRYGGSEMRGALVPPHTTADTEMAQQMQDIGHKPYRVSLQGITCSFASPATQRGDCDDVASPAKVHSFGPSTQCTSALPSRVLVSCSAVAVRCPGVMTASTAHDSVKSVVGGTLKQHQKTFSRKGDKTSRGRCDTAMTAETRLGYDRASITRSQRRRELYAWNRLLQQQLDEGSELSACVDVEEQIGILGDDHACGDAATFALLGASYSEDDAHMEGTQTLMSSEEAAGAASHNYLEALVQSDPRAGFEALHLGALTTIEAQEGWTSSAEELPNWLLPKVVFRTEMPVWREGGPQAGHALTLFHVVSAHAELASRAPVARCDGEVDDLLNRPSRALLSRALGADILHTLHRHLHPLIQPAAMPTSSHARRRSARKIKRVPRRCKRKKDKKSQGLGTKKILRVHRHKQPMMSSQAISIASMEELRLQGNALFATDPLKASSVYLAALELYEKRGTSSDALTQTCSLEEFTKSAGNALTCLYKVGNLQACLAVARRVLATNPIMAKANIFLARCLLDTPHPRRDEPLHDACETEKTAAVALQHLCRGVYELPTLAPAAQPLIECALRRLTEQSEKGRCIRGDQRGGDVGEPSTNDTGGLPTSQGTTRVVVRQGQCGNGVFADEALPAFAVVSSAHDPFSVCPYADGSATCCIHCGQALYHDREKKLCCMECNMVDYCSLMCFEAHKEQHLRYECDRLRRLKAVVTHISAQGVELPASLADVGFHCITTLASWHAGREGHTRLLHLVSHSDEVSVGLHPVVSLLQDLLAEDEPKELVATIVGVVQCNALELSDTTGLAVGQVLHCGSDTVTSLFNHSCTPNCSLVDGRDGTVITVRSIQPGEELTIAYIAELYWPTALRQRSLAKRYFFTCRCLRCSGALVDDTVFEAATQQARPSVSHEAVARCQGVVQELCCRIRALPVDEVGEVHLREVISCVQDMRQYLFDFHYLMHELRNLLTFIYAVLGRTRECLTSCLWELLMWEALNVGALPVKQMKVRNALRCVAELRASEGEQQLRLEDSSASALAPHLAAFASLYNVDEDA